MTFFLDHMHYIPLILLSALLPLTTLASSPITRTDGLKLLWAPLNRPAEETTETPFTDVPENHPDHLLITFAKARGIVEDSGAFSPDEPLRLNDALLWLLRSRNVDEWKNIRPDTVITYITRFPLGVKPEDLGQNAQISRERLTTIVKKLDDALKNQTHTVSYYSLDFAGRSTAFGEKFDPNALTAAHRTYPHNTLVRITNHNAELRSVVVRINDRGPYIDGRDMDLSRAAFGRIASLSNGVIDNVTFERLGYAKEVTTCTQTRYQRRLGKTLLDPGIPTVIEQGTTIELTADSAFRVIQMRKPGKRPVRSKKWQKTLSITFDRVGVTTFVLHEDSGRRRRFRTRVVPACT